MYSRQRTGVKAAIAKCLVIYVLGAVLAAAVSVANGEPTLSVPTAPGKAEELWRAAKDGRITIIEKLIEEGVPVDCQNPQDGDSTALMYAARNQQFKALKMLLDYGAKVDQKTKTGNTALLWAIYSPAEGKSPNADPAGCVSALLDAGANPNAVNYYGSSPLTSAAQNSPRFLRLLLAVHPKLNVEDGAGRTPLLAAARGGYVENVKALLDAGADVNQESRYGDTALTALLRSDSIRYKSEIVTLLKDAGAKKQQPTARRFLHVYDGLSRAQLWALATTALKRELVDMPAAMEFPRGAYTLKPIESYVDYRKSQLVYQWGIKDTAGLYAWLDNCEKNGDRLQLRKKSRKVFHSQTDTSKPEKPDPFAAAFHSKTPAPGLASPTGPGAKENNKYLAWDLCNYISVVKDSCLAGYMTPEEGWAKIMPIAARLQRAFSSWEEMGKDYQDAWEQKSGSRAPRYGEVCRMLVNPEDQNSPWNVFPWTTPLDNADVKP